MSLRFIRDRDTVFRKFTKKIVIRHLRKVHYKIIRKITNEFYEARLFGITPTRCFLVQRMPSLEWPRRYETWVHNDWLLDEQHTDRVMWFDSGYLGRPVRGLS